LELTQEQQALLDRTRERRTNLERERADFLRRSTEEPEGWISGGARTLASGATEGAAMLAGIPRGLADVSDWALGKVGVPEEYREYIPFSDAPSYSDMVRKASEVTGGYTDYTPETFTGKAAKNVTTFIPAALAAYLTGGTSLVPTLTAGAVVPGLAGAAAEPVGTKVGEMLGAEDPKQAGQYAKIGAEILSPFGATKVIPSLSKNLKDPRLQTAIEEIGELERFGVKATPGAYRTSQDAAREATLNEAANPKIAGIVSKQPEQFSAGILRDVGITDDVARAAGYSGGISPLNAGPITDRVASLLGQKIGSAYTGIQRNQIPPGDFSRISALAKSMPGFSKFQPGMSAGEWLHAVRKQAGDIQANAMNATGGKSYGPAAGQLIQAIDDAVLKAIGPDDFVELHTNNAMFSRLATVRDALARSKAAGREGVITPQDILASGGTRHTEDMTEMAEIADRYLLAKGVPLTAGNRRNVMRYIVDLMGGAVSAAVPTLLYGAGPGVAAKTALAAVLGGGGTHIVQKAIQAAKGSGYGQSVAKSHALYGTPVAPALAAPVASQITEREGRKSGGRVGMPHEAAADQLVMAAERAKKGISKGTESLLDMSDNHIAHALEVANRSI
jgi:hypothetical protein